jgi:diaminopimelate decarboxylase
MLDLYPDSATVENGELVLSGVTASSLADEFGTPLVVYCEQTLRARAHAYRESAPQAVTLYGSKAFPNAALLRLFAESGLGADVSTLGELELALRAGVPAERIVLHGNNKSDEELRRAADADAWLVVLDAADEAERVAVAGVRRVLVRVTPGIDPDTHDAIKTGHHGSKFGLPPDEALRLIAGARDLGLDVQGLHVHLGSQLLDVSPARFSASATSTRTQRRRSTTSCTRSSSAWSMRGRCTRCRSRGSCSSPGVPSSARRGSRSTASAS